MLALLAFVALAVTPFGLMTPARVVATRQRLATSAVKGVAIVPGVDVALADALNVVADNGHIPAGGNERCLQRCCIAGGLGEAILLARDQRLNSRDVIRERGAVGLDGVHVVGGGGRL